MRSSLDNYDRFMPRRSPLLICGASVRAAAWSAHRAGWREIHALDLFGDEDLRRNAIVRVLPMSEYPRGFLALSEVVPRGPFLYTGGLENDPLLIDRVASVRELWGNSGKTLRAVRDPLRLTQALQEAGLPHAEIRRDVPSSVEAAWMRKRRRGAGGLGVCLWDGGPLQRGEYLQRFIPGVPHAAVFQCSRESCHMLGVTRQLLREGTFQYCGSVGPVDLGGDVNRTLERLGQTLVARFQLRGVFGVDFVFHDGEPYPVEVNPRYTASIEILERALGMVCLDPSPTPPSYSDRWAKQILYARQDFTFPKEGPWRSSITSWDENPLPDYSDIPKEKTPLFAGQPILTLFATGPTEEACLASLEEKRLLTESRLYP